ncbi:caspase b-like isoform X1 [Triplophysa rosa]|uniref:caspase b-like isoform X1 n=1 Tax=Triplophysa rosa TaxID=992332 RepID=UPI002545C92B|nr:caspase b-like isoform X1 [Triplophysa rosa]XP_057187625.1 caspase b-like isoform X1 [Triplophysa rosa]
MATTTTAIFDALQELLESEFEEFKWRLSDGVDSDITSIPRGKLQKANRHEVVDIMVQQYGTSNAGTNAVKALRRIKQNERAKKLEKNLLHVYSMDSGGAGAGAAVAGASSAGSDGNTLDLK